MAANILNRPRAVAMSVYVIRAFVKMREELVAKTAILQRLAEIDKTLLIHDVALREIPEKLCRRLHPTSSIFRIFLRIFSCFRALEAYSFCCLNSACADVL